MRKIVIFLAATACALGVLLFALSGKRNESDMVAVGKVEEVAAPMRMSSGVSAPSQEHAGRSDLEASPETSVEDVAAPPKRLVRLSSDERRPGESDATFKTRSSWLRNFRSFEERAQMTPEQHEQFMQVLADTQEEAALGWKARADAGNEIRGLPNADWGTIPKIRDFSETMEAELLVKLRTILTHKQMVSFRRTSMLPAAFGYGLFKPLEMRDEAVATKGE